MYKLSYFYALNLIGFASGLGKSEFELNLAKVKKGRLLEKKILLVLGDNATGKSTFLSLIHPVSYPSDGREHFVIPGKEGVLVRTYLGDDGTQIITKCVYKPKGDSHNTKCSFLLLRLGQSEEDGVELNPTGNVSSYNKLVYTYFAVNKDYINFASYTDAVNGFVRMNGTERKNNVSTLIPNTERFALAYANISEKHKELRNMIRNISQKLMMFQDEDTMEYQLKKTDKELRELEKDRTELIRKAAKAEGRAKELRQGRSVEEMEQEQKLLLKQLSTVSSSLEESKQSIQYLSDQLNLEVDPNDVLMLLHTNRIQQEIQSYEKKVTKQETKLDNSEFRLRQVQKELNGEYAELNKAEASLVGVEIQDIDKLKRDREDYQKQVQSMRYSNHKELYENMSYEEILGFSRSVSVMDEMIQALYDEYGNLVSDYFKSLGKGEELTRPSLNVEELEATIVTNNKRKDVLYRQLIEKEQYRRLQDILEKRPVSCTIDTCPFIVNALQWNSIAKEIDNLQREYQELQVRITEDENQVKDHETYAKMLQGAMNLIHYIRGQAGLLDKYLDLSTQKLYQSIGNGTWNQVLDISRLKTMTAILSEKKQYDEIMRVKLPELNRLIEIAEVYGSNQSYIQSQIKRIQQKIASLKEEENTLHDQVHVTRWLVENLNRKLSAWKSLEATLIQYRDAFQIRVNNYQKIQQITEDLDVIHNLLQKANIAQRESNELTREIRERTALREKLLMDQTTLRNLKRDKEEVERDFTIVEVMKNIIQPGKGLRKELINLYMFDIFQLANDLLLNTFYGKLYLREFIITDKEFIIPYVYNGTEASDIAYASSSQQAMISMALSLAIISKLIDKYGVLGIDEADRTLSAENKAIFVETLAKQLKLVGINQAFIISHSPEFYESYDIGILAFPGAKFSKKNTDYYEVL